MKAIIGGRGTGRTWRLLQDASKENGLVVCHSIASADYTINMAIEMYRKGQLKSVPEIVWYGKLIGDNSRGGEVDLKELFIDNSDLLLRNLFKRDIATLTFCDDTEYKRR